MQRGRQSSPSLDGARRKPLRCAIYTRKSSEEGLEQSFNSLDAQRDACEAFIASQKHEGWIALPAAYDDGGFSGGSMQRPALQRLLDDVQNGLIDVVVVYKVDNRLSRSLSDFARLTDLFERHGTSFVSVTQQFNTSTSMGRLTLNVLLSFAQFEREVAGERIRDKIALSKRRGMWMGGLPPLGYDGIDRMLVVNEAEAATLRLIFRRYLEVGSVAELKRWLDAEDIVSKRRIFADGKTVGGVPLSRGAIYQILRNRLYRGEIAHRGEVHKGNHMPIIDRDLWASVQERLTEQSQRKRGSASRRSEAALLAGLLFDGDGNRLTPTYAAKRGRRYRYYVSAPLVRGGKAKNGMRLPARDVERLVCKAFAGQLLDPLWLADSIGRDASSRGMRSLIDAAAQLARSLTDDQSRREGGLTVGCRQLIRRIVVAKGSITISLDRGALMRAVAGIDAPPTATITGGDEPLEIVVAAQALRCGKQIRLILGEVTIERRSVDPALIRLIGDTHRWFEDLRSGRATTIAEIAQRDGQQVSHVSQTLSLAFLAPDIVEMILDGRQPPTLTIERLKARRPLPLDWPGQRALLLA